MSLNWEDVPEDCHGFHGEWYYGSVAAIWHVGSHGYCIEYKSRCIVSSRSHVISGPYETLDAAKAAYRLIAGV